MNTSTRATGILAFALFSGYHVITQAGICRSRGLGSSLGPWDCRRHVHGFRLGGNLEGVAFSPCLIVSRGCQCSASYTRGLMRLHRQRLRVFRPCSHISRARRGTFARLLTRSPAMLRHRLTGIARSGSFFSGCAVPDGLSLSYGQRRARHSGVRLCGFDLSTCKNCNDNTQKKKGVLGSF